MSAQRPGSRLGRAGRTRSDPAGFGGAAPIAAGAAALFVALAPAPAYAQQGGVALDQFEPTPAGDTFARVPSPFARGELVPRGVATFELAGSPLRLVQDGKTTDIVSSQAFLHLSASFAIDDRLLVSADMPVAVLQGGDSGTISGATVPAKKTAEAGDLRVGLRVRLWGEDDGPLQVGVGTHLYLPTAGADSYAGEGGVRIAPQLSLGGRLRAAPGVALHWGAFGGALVRDSTNPSMIDYGAGALAGLANDRVRVGAEIYAATPLQDGQFMAPGGALLPANQSTNAEALLEAHARLPLGFVAGAAGGPGLGHAVGTPAYRVAVTFGWAPEGAARRRDGVGPVGDADADGIPDAEDACPYAFGPRRSPAAKNGCPQLDDDDDGIPNEEDACPAEYGIATGDPRTNGCPAPPLADGDGDGIPDRDDACPHEKGPPNRDRAKNGCPVVSNDKDSDGDGIPDSEDACPRDKGKATAEPNTNGCPAHARVTATEIVLLTPIAFGAGKGKPAIDAAAEAALTDVRDVLTNHPEFAKIEIQSHAAGGNPGDLGAATTTARAQAVRDWLVAHGVPAARLTAKGYASSKPLADAKTAEGKARNERIVFVVTSK